MPRYARFMLTYPGVWTSLADGRYRFAMGTVDDHEVRGTGGVLVDLESGDLHADDLRHKTLFEVFGLDELPIHLHERKGNDVALTFKSASVREAVRKITAFQGRISDGHKDTVLIIDRVFPAESIKLLVEILRIIARENLANDGAPPLQPASVLTEVSVLRTEAVEIGKTYLIDYTNYRGERKTRYIAVTGFTFGTNAYHLKPGLIIQAQDVERGEDRTFANDGIHAIWAFSKP